MLFTREKSEINTAEKLGLPNWGGWVGGKKTKPATAQKCYEEGQVVQVFSAFHDSDNIRFPFITHILQLHNSIRGAGDFLQGDICMSMSLQGSCLSLN